MITSLLKLVKNFALRLFFGPPLVNYSHKSDCFEDIVEHFLNKSEHVIRSKFFLIFRKYYFWHF